MFYKIAILIVFSFFHENEANASVANDTSINNLCNYINKPIKLFIENCGNNIVDTIANRSYTGMVISVFLLLNNGDYYEVFPAYKKGFIHEKELIKERFRLDLISELDLKFVRLKRKGEIIQSCD